MTRASYDAALAGLGVPPEDRARRAQQLERFLAAGFPDKHVEEWRYTDLATLSQQSFAPANDPAAIPDLAPVLLDGCDRIVLVNGRLRPELGHGDAGGTLSHRAAWPQATHEFERDTLACLNEALASDGAVLRVPADRTLERPVHIVLVTVPGTQPDMSHWSHVIELAPRARASVIVQHVGGGDASHFATHSLSVRVMDGAHLDLVRVQDEGAGTTHLFRGDALVESQARLNVVNVDLGGGLVRNNWNVELAAPHATVDLAGLYAPNGRTHVDNHTRIDHRWPHGTSREAFRGVIGDQARAVFNGKIVVHQGAQKTDSEQRVANLLTSKSAEVNAKPELEIYADDVKCAHGATVGRLDEQAVFYLRSRGLPLETARALLTYTFAYDILGRIGHEPARKMVEHRFLERLPQGIDLDGLV